MTSKYDLKYDKLIINILKLNNDFKKMRYQPTFVILTKYILSCTTFNRIYNNSHVLWGIYYIFVKL